MNSINSSNFPIFNRFWNDSCTIFILMHFFFFSLFISKKKTNNEMEQKRQHPLYCAVAIAIASTIVHCSALNASIINSKRQRYFSIKNNFLSLFECLCLYWVNERARCRFFSLSVFLSFHWKCALIASFCARNLPVNEVECTFSSCCLY